MPNASVLHINTYDIAGGAEEFALYISTVNNDYLIVKEKLTKNNNVIEFKKTLIDKIFILLNKIIWKLGFRKTFKQLFSITEEFNNTYNKLKKLKEYQTAKIIHFHNLHGGYFDINAIKKIAKEKKIVWTTHDMWAITGGEAYYFNFSDIKKGNAKSPYKKNYPLNNPVIDRRNYYLNKKKNIYQLFSDSIFFVTPSNYVLSEFKKAYAYNNNINIKTIYNGIDTSIFFNKQKRNWKIPKILFFNSKSPFKNSNFFISVLDKISFNIELHVFGSTLIANNKNFKIINHNFITNRKELAELYNNSDILIFASQQETFALIPAEASACGVFVLASDIPAIREQSECYPIELFDNNKPYELINKLSAISNNIHETRKKGLEASEKIKQNLSRSISINNYNLLYESIIKKSK